MKAEPRKKYKEILKFTNSVNLNIELILAPSRRQLNKNIKVMNQAGRISKMNLG